MPHTTPWNLDACWLLPREVRWLPCSLDTHTLTIRRGDATYETSLYYAGTAPWLCHDILGPAANGWPQIHPPGGSTAPLSTPEHVTYLFVRSWHGANGSEGAKEGARVVHPPA